MRRMGSYWIIAALSALTTPVIALAQSLDGDPKFASAPSITESSTVTAAEDPPRSEQEQPPTYSPALDGTGLISMDSRASGHLLLGATMSGGWDSNPDNLSNGTATGLYTISPYIGLQEVTPRLRALLQYEFTNTRFKSNYAAQTMNVGSMRILRSVSDRWSLDLRATGGYGDDSIRFLGSPQTVAVGEVPGAGPNAASYLPNAGTVTNIEGGTEVKFRKSQRDTIEIRADDSFSHYASLGASNSIATVAASYERDLSPALGAIAYEQNSFYYGALKCQSFGLGAGLSWRPREQTTLTLAGGPQLDTTSCGSQQGFAFTGSFSSRLTGRSQIYLLSARQPTTSYLGPGLWQQSVSGGYQRQIASIGNIGFDIGYVASDTLTTVSSYHGTYFDCVYGYRLGHGIHASYSYRGYVGDSGGTRFSRDVAQFSIVWTPGAGHIFQ